MIEYGQLIEYNIKSIFLKKPCTKFCGVTSPRPFSGKLKLRISKVLYSLFLLYPKLVAIEIYWN